MCKGAPPQKTVTSYYFKITDGEFLFVGVPFEARCEWPLLGYCLVFFFFLLKFYQIGKNWLKIFLPKNLTTHIPIIKPETIWANNILFILPCSETKNQPKDKTLGNGEKIDLNFSYWKMTNKKNKNPQFFFIINLDLSYRRRKKIFQFQLKLAVI